MQHDNHTQFAASNSFASDPEAKNIVREASKKPNPPQANPLLQRIQMPGETFALPSGGLFYHDDEFDPSVENAEVHVHPMTTIDEIALKTPDMLFSGEAVRQVFRRCIPQITNVDKLLAKDVDFLLTCLRKVSFGDEMRVQYKHNCENAKEHTYTINIGTFIRESRKIDPTTVEHSFNVDMPNGQKVHLQPIRFKEFIHIMQTFNDDKNSAIEDLNNNVIDSIMSVIERVDEVADKNMIREWVAQIPPSFINLINDHVDKTVEWGPSFEYQVHCQDCGEAVSIEAPMNPLAFFT